MTKKKKKSWALFLIRFLGQLLFRQRVWSFEIRTGVVVNSWGQKPSLVCHNHICHYHKLHLESRLLSAFQEFEGCSLHCVLSSLVLAITFEVLLQTDSLTPKDSALESDLPLNEKPEDQQNNTSCVALEKFLFHCCNIRRHRQHQDCIPTYLTRIHINSDVVLCSLCFVP